MDNELYDYRTITAATVAALADRAIGAADEQVAAAVRARPATFATTMGPLEEAGRIVADAYGEGAFLARVHPEADVRSAGVAAEERLTKWRSDLVFRRDLYEAITAFADTGEAADLSGPRRRLLDHWVRDLRRTGHDLDPGSREKLRDLKTRLIELEVAFGKNLDEWQDAIIVNREGLDGLPESYVAGLERSEDGGFRVSLDYPEYIPFMQQATDRELRRRLQHKSWNRAVNANLPLLAEARALRGQIAQLLGHPTWADYQMEVKMAREPAKVHDFYESIVPGLTKKGHRELEILTALHHSLGVDDAVQTWDWSFLHTTQKKNDYGVDQNEIAEYFSLDRVLNGMFEITGETFGLTYRRLETEGAWHPDVMLFEIADAAAAEPIAYFYADLFPREGKFTHAAAFPLVYGMRLVDGRYRKPVAAIVANFTKPTETAPSLLKHSEALTLFHEFGHILHFCLTTVDLISFSGFDTEWDFVEAPSQIMENWMWEPEILQRFATHHVTDEPIPAHLVKQLVAARDLNVGLHTLRQVHLGQTDLLMHEGDGDDLDAIQRKAHEYTLLPYHEGTHFVAGFGHLMGGYDAGYYGYLWSAVYGDDMFSAFEAAGLTNRTVGMRYRDEVLATGGSRDAIDHLRAFLGREPNSEAFLRRLGLRDS